MTGAVKVACPNDQDRVMLSPEWLLRNDRDKVALYLLSNYEGVHFVLESAEGITLALFNGRRSLADIAAQVGYLFACSQEAAESFVRRLLGKLSSQGGSALLSRHPLFLPAVGPEQVRDDLEPFQYLTVSSLKSGPSGSRLHAPLSLTLFFTNLCQTDCRYCYAEREWLDPARWLSLTEWRLVLQQARAMEIRIANLSGGDTLARRDAFDFLTLLLEFDLLFFVSTKCHVSRSAAERLVAAGFLNPVQSVPRGFQISLDSVDPRVAAHLTQRGNYLERALDSLRNLRSVGISPVVKAVITPFNAEGWLEYVETMQQLGIRDINFTYYSPSFYRHSPDLLVPAAQRERLADTAAELASRYPAMEFSGNVFSRSRAGGEASRVVREADKWASRNGCSGGRTALGITADGRAVICEQAPQHAPFVFGDVRRSTLSEIWHSEELREFIFPPRENFVGRSCYECPEFDECQYVRGNCFRDAYFASGTPFDAPPRCPRGHARNPALAATCGDGPGASGTSSDL